MKTLLLLIVGLTINISCYSQELSFNEGTTTLPESSKKITKEEALAYVNLKLKGDKMLSEFISGNKSENIYRVNDVIVTINTQTVNVKENQLLTDKQGFDWGARKDPSYKSELKTINNNTVLIIYKTRGDIGYYYFYANNFNHSRLASGAFYFEKSNNEQARAVLDHVITHLKFKD